jgi:hypothetical protein
VQELLLGADAAGPVQALQTLTAEDLQGLLQRTLDPAQQFVSFLTPMGSGR